MNELFRKAFQDSAVLRQVILESDEMQKVMDDLIAACVQSLKNGSKILFCGNGGSAADAQHLAAELSGRFAYNRPPIASEALHVNSSFMTAVANDYSYEETYARMVHAIGKKGDVLIALSTSGNSPNILNALRAAKTLGMVTAGFSGETGGKMCDHCMLMLKVPSMSTPRIQEVHITLGHILCEAIETAIYPRP